MNIEAIRSVVKDWQQAKIIGGKAAYEKLIREDVPELLDKLEAVEEACEDVGEPIGYDRVYALAQSILAILEGGER